ncbi:Zinc finger, LIM-type [Dillenia turbinata]|uniref:Zinc finger, LIM-type n=1 Tax=Dillenia turbinata TaxID=194707 RepID=A0AAN8VWD4_9MAGN
MTFTGTLDKCKACDKTVYFIELISADGATYHKTCFKCSHCNGLLVMSNYSSMDGVLYCKPHFEQLFKETGSFTTKKFQTREFLLISIFKFTSARQGGLNRAPSKVSALFSGTQDKCATCKKTAYPLEKVTVEGEIYHKLCFRCAHGGCKLTPSTYAALDGIPYCKPHFAQLFMQKGSYQHLTNIATMKKNAVSIPEAEPKEAVANGNEDHIQDQS